MNIKAEINDLKWKKKYTHTHKHQKQIKNRINRTMKSGSGSFKKQYYNLARLIKRKRVRTQKIEIISERGEIINNTEIQF